MIPDEFAGPRGSHFQRSLPVAGSPLISFLGPEPEVQYEAIRGITCETPDCRPAICRDCYYLEIGTHMSPAGVRAARADCVIDNDLC